jgi:hyperosmotically inducible protein
MNANMLPARDALPHGKLFLKAVVLAGLAVALGLGLSNANGATQDAASAASNATTTHKTERVISDSWITTKVKSEILKSSLAKGFDVKVTTLHGIVTLRGTLASADAIDQVKAVAVKVKGVQSVDTSTLAVAAK